MSKSILDVVSLHAATVVMVELGKLLPARIQPDLIADQYENGREHGFTICDMATERQVSFSEFRHTDELVVYFGHPSEFEDQGCFSDEVYENKKLFSGDLAGYSKAAKFIAKYLRNIK